ncbi:hypothetical protein BDP27DRAFT_1371095 [Rhodocollybia butyracea]|uniref:Uncharacterized protein n=1 Tax=Rhodocollybia butyracea TaxID=206335 RepID=A0A9P5TYG9_9AGAR|nr:hypothetical protein BDP27DRAFT_1371095 [Rhodocollybia butyracea]
MNPILACSAVALIEVGEEEAEEVGERSSVFGGVSGQPVDNGEVSTLTALSVNNGIDGESKDAEDIGDDSIDGESEDIGDDGVNGEIEDTEEVGDEDRYFCSWLPHEAGPSSHHRHLNTDSPLGGFKKGKLCVSSSAVVRDVQAEQNMPPHFRQ